MAKFASAKSQATAVIKLLQGRAGNQESFPENEIGKGLTRTNSVESDKVLKSVGTVRNYEQALTQVAKYAKNNKVKGGLRGITPAIASEYLELRSLEVGQKALDMERQALQAMMHHVTYTLKQGETLYREKTKLTEKLKPRAYTHEQALYVANAQTKPHQLATEIALSAGLRAHELFTLRRMDEIKPDNRPSAKTKWLGKQGKQGKRYTVKGKGGLVREVILREDLAEELESQRLPTPIAIKDRNVHYQSHYSINGGQKWSNSYSSASKRVLGWSTGAHGLRHTYAQQRMRELKQHGLTRNQALRTVSQEMGHFRPEITEVYLR